MADQGQTKSERTENERKGTTEDVDAAVLAQFQAFKLAGFALGQAAWSVEDGDSLVPLGIVEHDGQREAHRFATEITPQRLTEHYRILGEKIVPASYGVLVIEFTSTLPSGEPIAVLGVSLIDAEGELVGTITQPFRPARRSRIPGRSSAFSVVGTPSFADEIDIPGAREALLAGVLSHPEGRRLFPQLMAMAVDAYG